ncbi:hypothetical protein Taro_004851 [Colocasia esculenta]|uniref:Uncharacterized protein n=1 Tax=Colocasia esculenta TaxID=4460 RepID=A0A843TW54_COLES|nr:hypothetical protein [Colocasia esculenta]
MVRTLVVSTQCFKYKAKRSSSVDTSSGSVDTRDSSQNNLLDNLGQCVDTSSSSVDTRDSSQNNLLDNLG